VSGFGSADYTPDLELALELADIADGITAARFRAGDLRVERKPDRTPVTDADTAAEDAMRRVLSERRPGDAVLGEERGGSGVHGRGWLLDPIDGTKNFSRGMPVWATLIALAEDGRPVVGVVSAPALGRRWWASAGDGAHARNPDGMVRRISVSGVSALEDACLSTTELSTWASMDALPRYLDLSARCWVTRAWGDFYQHVLVAEGSIDIGVDGEANPWDLAAVQIVVTEAGGRFSDLSGAERYDGGNGLSSNGALHDVALAVLAGRDPAEGPASSA
jgi:histidinol-phosphatase